MTATRTFTVQGMSCSHCVAAVTEELTKLDGVTHVEVDLVSGRLTIESSHALDDADLAAAVDEAGYTIAT